MHTLYSRILKIKQPQACQLLGGVDRANFSCEAKHHSEEHSHTNRAESSCRPGRPCSAQDLSLGSFAVAYALLLLALLFYSDKQKHLLHIHCDSTYSFTLSCFISSYKPPLFGLVHLKAVYLTCKSQPTRSLFFPSISSLFFLSPSSQCNTDFKQQEGIPPCLFSHLLLLCNDLNLSVSVSYHLRQ